MSLASNHVKLMVDMYRRLGDDRPLLNHINGLFDHEPYHDLAQQPYVWMPGPNVGACREDGDTEEHTIVVMVSAHNVASASVVAAMVLQATPYPGSSRVVYDGRDMACIRCEIVVTLAAAKVGA